MFFDGESPGVQQRSAKIILQMEKIGHQERIQRMLADDNFREDVKVISGPDFQAAAQQESLGLDRSGALVLL